MKKSFLVLSVLLTALAANAHGASAKLAKASKARASAPQADLVGTSEEAANVSTGTGGMIEGGLTFRWHTVPPPAPAP